MKNAFLSISAFCHTALDIFRNGGFPPYGRLVSGLNEQFYSIKAALNDEPGVTRRCVTVDTVGGVYAFYYGRDKRGRMRYPWFILRRLGRIL